MNNSTHVPDGIQKQRDWLTNQAMMVQPCWACGVPCNQFDAAQSEAFTPWNTAGVTFVCPNCDCPMADAVPLVAVGPVHWFWARPANLIVTGTEWRKSDA